MPAPQNFTFPADHENEYGINLNITCEEYVWWPSEYNISMWYWTNPQFVTAFTVNSISVFACLIVICFITFMRFKRPVSANRVSLRLTLGVAIADMCTSVCLGGFYLPKPGCAAFPLMCGYIFFGTLSSFFTAAIALNLQIVFVHGYTRTQRFQKYYFIVPSIISLGLVAGALWSRTIVFNFSWFADDTNTIGIIHEWAFFFGWQVLSLIYCTLGVILVARKMLIATKESEMLRKNGGVNMRPVILRAVRRIVFYPMVPIFCITFNIASAILNYTDGGTEAFRYFAVAVQGSAGWLNALVFLFDPVIWKEFNLNLGHTDGSRTHGSTIGSGQAEASKATFHEVDDKNHFGSGKTDSRVGWNDLKKEKSGFSDIPIHEDAKAEQGDEYHQRYGYPESNEKLTKYDDVWIRLESIGEEGQAKQMESSGDDDTRRAQSRASRRSKNQEEMHYLGLL